MTSFWRFKKNYWHENIGTSERIYDGLNAEFFHQFLIDHNALHVQYV